jgi:uncharacterized integral membrane protein
MFLMKLTTLLLLVILTAITAFAALNWSVFITPTELSLGYTTARIPLGLVMLGLLVFVMALFLVFVVYLQTSALLETRRQSRELKASRELADQAEASRFSELRNLVVAQLLQLTNLHAESKSEVMTRTEQLESNLRTAIEESGNTLAAYIGELEDRLEKSKIPSAAG